MLEACTVSNTPLAVIGRRPCAPCSGALEAPQLGLDAYVFSPGAPATAGEAADAAFLRMLLLSRPAM